MTATPESKIEIDHGELHRKLKDVRDYLSELRYIDLAQERIHSHNRAIALAGPSTGNEYFNLQLGIQYPFTESMLVPFPAALTGPTKVHELLTPLLVEAHQWTKSQMDYLDHRVQEIMHYQLNGYAPIDWHLEKVSDSLAGVDTNFGFLEGELSRWIGTAATDFRSGFYSKYRTVHRNQLKLAESLRGALGASRRTIEYSQQSVLNALTSARQAILEQLQLRSVGKVDSTGKVALLAVAAAFTILSVPLAPLSLWLASGSAALAFTAGTAASELPWSATDERMIMGRSADELYLSLYESIRDVDAFLARNLDDIHDHLRNVRGEVEKLYRTNAIIPKRPHVTDGVSPAEFHHSSSEQY